MADAYLYNAADTSEIKVRKTPSWPKNWADFSLLYSCSCICTGMHGSTCMFWANLTPFSLKGQANPWWTAGRPFTIVTEILPRLKFEACWHGQYDSLITKAAVPCGR